MQCCGETVLEYWSGGIVNFGFCQLPIANCHLAFWGLSLTHWTLDFEL